MTCLPNWTVLYPILYLESSSRTTHAGFRNKDAENESVPALKFRKKLPQILIQTGEHYKQSQMDSRRRPSLSAS